MSAVRRLGYCISIVLFVLMGVVLVGSAVSTNASALQPETAYPAGLLENRVASHTDDLAPLTDTITGTLNIYIPFVLRTNPILCGEIITNTVLTAVEGPYLVICGVHVATGIKLTIEAGATLEFTSAGNNLFISGELQAVGTEQAPIYFQPLNSTTPGSWGAVAFMPGSSGVLDHAILKYGGGNNWYSLLSMVYIASDAVRVVDSVVQNSLETGISINSASPVISATQILTNANGGMYIYFSDSPLVQNNIFADNSAGSGGGLSIVSSNPVIQNNTFSHNHANNGGGGIYNYLESYPNGGSPTIVNNILVGNSASYGGGIFNPQGTPVLDYNDVWNNTGGDYLGVAPGIHDLSADPILSDPANRDYHLASDSPCIDAGDPDSHPKADFEGDPRPMGLAPDIGADEYRTLGVIKTSLPAEASPGAPVTYTLRLFNGSAVTLTNVLLTDTLPVETAFTGYQADGFTCSNNAAWGGTVKCTLGSFDLAPGESRMVTMTVMLTETLAVNQYVTNTVWAYADTGNGILFARDQVRTRVLWCAVQLNDTPMGSDLQAAINASTQATDVVKVSGYCRVHDLALNKTLTLQGGWRRDFGERNPVVYTTTLDGQKLGRVIFVDGEVVPTIEGFIITGGENINPGGGGIAISSGSPTIQSNTFTHNSAGGDNGGGIYNTSGSPILINNLFKDNDASSGGGIYNDSGSPIIENNIFINSCGGAVRSVNGDPIVVSNILMNPNNICWGGIMIDSGNPTVDYNDRWNIDYLTNTHDISADPMFVDPEHGDYHLSASSPCIDAGDPVNRPSTDFEGDPRPMGLAPDIGVDEHRTLGVIKTSLPAETSPGAPLTYTIRLFNGSAVTLTNVHLIDTLPIETTFTGYQAEGLTCAHDGAAWGGLLSCTLDSVSLAPGESRFVTMTVILTESLTAQQYITNPVVMTAVAGSSPYTARDQARTQVMWCAVQLNDTPMGSDLQAAIDASTQATDVVKVGGYCRVHDLTLDKTLILQGGWRYDFGERNPGVYTTTLDAQGLGGVMWVDGDVTPTVEGFVITGGKTNGSGGGISISTGSPTIQNNTISGNSADTSGGGLYIESGSPLIQNNTFAQNSVNAWYTYGGGLYNQSGSPLIQNNTFTRNSISGFYVYGGGLCSGSGSPTIQNNTFTNNSAGYLGFGGGLAIMSGIPIIQGNTFTSNAAIVGGGLYNNGSSLIQNNFFITNTAAMDGGGLENSSDAIIQNNIFSDNQSGDKGGGLSTSTTGSPTIQNNTFYNNTAGYGGGLSIWAGSPMVRSNIVVNNTASEEGGGIYNNSGTPTLRYNDVWNNAGGNYFGIDPGAHDISSNPRLVDPAHGNFHLTSNSPCINKADPVNFPPTDFEGDPRPHGPAPDIGADEYYARSD